MARAAAKADPEAVRDEYDSVFVGAGARAVGVSGEDAGMFRAEPKQGGKLGRTGEIREVQTSLLDTLLEHGYLPVVSPVSRGPDGGCSQADLRSTGGDGLFYCFAAN